MALILFPLLGRAHRLSEAGVAQARGERTRVSKPLRTTHKCRVRYDIYLESDGVGGRFPQHASMLLCREKGPNGMCSKLSCLAELGL